MVTTDRVRLNVEVSPEINDLLEELVGEFGVRDVGEVLLKAIALAKVAADAKEHGQKLFVGVGPGSDTVREITGI